MVKFPAAVYYPAMKTVKFQTTWGIITLITDDSGKPVSLDLPPLKETPRRKFSGLAPSKTAMDFFQALEKMFPKIPTPGGTEFQKAVWREIKKIPHGQTRTYGEIAAAIGRSKAVRAVGTACGANPLPVLIPCHRVVAKAGLGGYGSGLPWKLLLLKTEGAADGFVPQDFCSRSA